MTTKVWRVDPHCPDPEIIAQAARLLRQGGLVAFPTETVYGLGANALDREAVRKVFLAKGRPSWDPLIVHINDLSMLELVVAEVPPMFAELAQRFLPGPLTIVMKKKASVPDEVTAGLPTVAVRMPRHPVALSLIAAANVPIAAPSANRFGRPSPTTAEHVWCDLAGRIDAILDAGATAVGVESTVLDLTKTPPVILRPGGVSKEALEALLGEVIVATADTAKVSEGLPSPGMMPRHYAPSVPVWLSDGSEASLAEVIGQLQQQGYASKDIGVLLPKGWVLPEGQFVTFPWGQWGNWEELAQRLFDGLRWLEQQTIAAIVAPLPPPVGLGLALRDRLLKAATPPSEVLDEK